MLYKILWGKRKYVILPLNFDLFKFYLAEKKLNLGQYLNQSERGKTKVTCFAWLSHSVISVNTVISFFSFLFRILLKKF